MKTEILAPNERNIKLCAQYLAGGGVVAFPTETVYGLGANAFNENAAKQIYEVKGRPSDNPLIVHVYDFEQIYALVKEVTPVGKILMKRFMPGPLTLIFKKQDSVPKSITGGLDTVGVRMPSDKVCRQFLRECNIPVCAPSANTSTMPSPTCAAHVYSDLKGKIPYILDGGDCDIGLESTIVDVSENVPKLLRAGGISKEKIEEVCGCEVSSVGGGSVALCPGMKYKHYSPKATVLFSAYYYDMPRNIQSRYDSLVAEGKKTVVLCLNKNAACYGKRNVYKMGGDYCEYAHNLFAALRLADDESYDVVIAEGVPSDGIGEAIINRLIKSSGGVII